MLDFLQHLEVGFMHVRAGREPLLLNTVDRLAETRQQCRVEQNRLRDNAIAEVVDAVVDTAAN